jgi:hypothetical protein
MPPDKTINFAARCEYLSAIEVLWPDVTESLRLRAFPLYQKYFESADQGMALQTVAALEDALKRDAPMEIRQVKLAVRRWAKEFGFQDAWLRDAALQSMHNWAGGGTMSKWTYLPEGLDTPTFQPEFGVWIPFFTKWPEFKRLTDERYRRALAQYRAEIRTLWGEGQPKLSQTAVWTVLWQRGKSPEAIRIHHLKTMGKNISLANIQLRVHAFAASAGLSLRMNKAGPRANIAST